MINILTYSHFSNELVQTSSGISRSVLHVGLNVRLSTYMYTGETPRTGKLTLVIAIFLCVKFHISIGWLRCHTMRARS